MFKLLCCSAVLLACVAADVSHLVRQARFPPPPPVGLGFVPLGPAPPSGAPIAILRQSQDVAPDGTYQWAYETANGISAEEQGRPAQVGQETAEQVSGSFQYTAPDGSPVAVSYIANENGFQPQGNVLPTPPPIPEAIQRSLEFNARNAPPSNQQ